MSIDEIMTTVFVAAVIAATVFALRTGKAIYGNVIVRFLYVERSRQPLLFWAILAFYWIAAFYAVADLSFPGFTRL